MKIRTKRRKMTPPKKMAITTIPSNLKRVRVKMMNNLKNQNLTTSYRIKTKIKAMRERLNRAMKTKHKQRIPT